MVIGNGCYGKQFSSTQSNESIRASFLTYCLLYALVPISFLKVYKYNRVLSEYFIL